jgi:hypothetical protein
LRIVPSAHINGWITGATRFVRVSILAKRALLKEAHKTVQPELIDGSTIGAIRSARAFKGISSSTIPLKVALSVLINGSTIGATRSARNSKLMWTGSDVNHLPSPVWPDIPPPSYRPVASRVHPVSLDPLSPQPRLSGHHTLQNVVHSLPLSYTFLTYL